MPCHWCGGEGKATNNSSINTYLPTYLMYNLSNSERNLALIFNFFERNVSFDLHEQKTKKSREMNQFLEWQFLLDIN